MDEQLTDLKPEDYKLLSDMSFAISTGGAAEIEVTEEKSIFDFSRKIIWIFEFMKISNGFRAFEFRISNNLNNLDI